MFWTFYSALPLVHKCQPHLLRLRSYGLELLGQWFLTKLPCEKLGNLRRNAKVFAFKS